MPDLEQAARKWLDACNKHDLNALMALYHPNVVNVQPHTPQPLKGKEATRQDFQAFFTAFPDLRMEFLVIAVKGDTVATEWEFTGTHKGPLPGPNGPIPPTNKRVRVKGAEFTKNDSQGLIIDERGYFDLMSLMGQLALLPGR